MRFALASTLGLAACGTTIHRIPTNAPPHAVQARPPEAVEVFTATAPARPFVEVAYFEAQPESQLSLDDTNDVFDKLRARAAATGCDGLIITGASDRVVGDHKHVDTLHGFAATCIVYR